MEDNRPTKAEFLNMPASYRRQHTMALNPAGDPFIPHGMTPDQAAAINAALTQERLQRMQIAKPRTAVIVNGQSHAQQSSGIRTVKDEA